MRLHHYSIHTERSYTDWIRRYIHFHHMRSREDLANGETKIEAFCTDLAVNGKVSPSTQNQAFNALVFLYRQVLKLPLEDQINAVRAERKINLPVVLTREEVVKVLALLEGEPQLVVKLLYGSGLRIMEAARLRVKDVDLAMKQVTVRSVQVSPIRAGVNRQKSCRSQFFFDRADSPLPRSSFATRYSNPSFRL